MLDDALHYLSLGWAVLPLCPPDHVGTGKAHRGCGSPGKRPFFPDRPPAASGEWKEYQDRLPTADEVRGWWKAHPRLNVGVALGPVSGIVAIDIDDDDGEVLLQDLSGGDLPHTWEYTTGKGRRLVYRLPPDKTVRSVPFKRLGTEIEILRLMGRGGQIVLPPSAHPNGSVYRWKTLAGPDDMPAADVPEWMTAVPVPDRTGPAPADGELIGEGGRNTYLTVLAGAMRKRGADEEAILAAIQSTNERRCDPPLADDEVRSVARSVARYEPDAFTGVTIKFPESGTGVGPKEEPEPLTAADVARIADLKRAGAEVRWLCPGWIQRGVLTAFAAEGGTGKTRATADLVRRIRRNLPWPDGTPMTVEAPETVALWVVADNHHDEMVSLTEAFGIDDCVAINAHPTDPYGGVTLETLEDFVMLEKRVKLVRPLLVIVDTVGNSTDKNLSKQEDAKAFYQPLQLIARRQNVAVLCLTHLNAGGKILGRRALEKVRTCLRMSAETINDTNCRRRLEVVKSNSKYPPALGVTMGDGGNEYDTDPPAAPEDRDSADKINPKTAGCMDWLKDEVAGTPRPVADLRTAAENKGFSAKVLYDAKGKLGLIETKRSGRLWWGMPGAEPKPLRIVFPES